MFPWERSHRQIEEWIDVPPAEPASEEQGDSRIAAQVGIH